MKILLIQAPYFIPYKELYRTEWLGLLYLASSLKRGGFDVHIFDPTIETPIKMENGFFYSVSDEKFASIIKGYNPDVVGISIQNRFSYDGACKVARIAKRVSQNRIVTVAGGVYPSVYKDKMLTNKKATAFDFAFQGEAEHTFLNFLSSYPSILSDLDTVDGLIYRSSGKVICNKKTHFISDLDELPFPARDLVDIETYMNSTPVLYGLGSHRALSLLTSRSCPYRCTFCNMKLIHGPRLRVRSVDNVLLELDELTAKYEAKEFFVMDDTFTCQVKRAKEICEGIIRKGYNIRWNTPNGISAREVDIELATLMKKAGCASVCIAIESGSDYVRNQLINKRLSNEQILKTVECFRKADIPIGGFLIVGMPGEKELYHKESVKFIRRLKLSFIVVSYAFPFPGTQMHEELIAKGYIKQDFDVQYDSYEYPVFDTEDFTKVDVIHRKSELMRAFYFNNGVRIAIELLTNKQYMIDFYATHAKRMVSKFIAGKR